MSDLGVDIGGTKIQLTTFGTDAHVRSSTTVPTALLRRGTPVFAKDLVGLLRSMRADEHEHLGLTLNGVLRGGHVEYSSLMGGAVDFPLADYLACELAMPVSVDDDIHAMGLAEYQFGLGRRHESVAMVNIGTGIGVAYVEAGKVLRGRFAAGLLSEQRTWIDALGQWRSLDRTVSGRGLRGMYRELTGDDVEAITVMRRFGEQDSHARIAVEAFASALAWTLQFISRVYHPEAIAVAGSVSRSWSLFGADVVEMYVSGLEPAFRAQVLAPSDVTHAAERGVLLQRRPERR